MKNKFISLLTAMALIMSIMPVFELPVFAAGEITTIATLADLEVLRDSVNNGNTYEGVTVTLTADIDMSPTYSSSGKSWTPIGSSGTPGNSGIQFKGIFNGGGYTISNLYISFGNDYAGLFGNNRGTIQNLKLTGVSATGNIRYSGGICGLNDGTITNCSVSGTEIKSTFGSGGHVGGIVGYNHYYGTVSNCRNTCTVSGGSYTGGIAGTNYNTITNCCNTGVVSGGSYTGGVVGFMSGETLSNCYNTGEVTAATTDISTSAGGVVGSISGKTVSNCYNIGAVTAKGSLVYVGGIVGSTHASEVSSCYYNSEAFTGSAVGLLEHTGTITVDVAGKTEAELAKQETFVGWDFPNTWEMSTAFGRPILKSNPEPPFKGEGMEADPYLIPNLAALEKLRENVNGGTDYKDTYFKLTADIDLSGMGSWTPIGYDKKPFKGTFDGNGHTISNLYINAGGGYAGLFGYSNGTIQNLKLTDVNITGDISNIGGVCGKNDNGTITSCSVSGTVTSPSTWNYVGGITGYNTGTIANCDNSCTLTTYDNTGGICGCNTGTVSECNNTGTIANGTVTGGIVGEMKYGTISNCCNTGAVTANYMYDCRAGGIVGRMSDDSKVFGCCNTGAVIAGGIQTAAYGGGIAGYMSGSSVSNCYNTGMISKGDSDGGIAGYMSGGTVSKSYNIGLVKDGKYTGGVVGEMKGGTVSQSYNAGSIQGSSNIGGVVGGFESNNSATITTCYNIGDIVMLYNLAHAGGVAGYIKNGGTVNVTNCYYISTESSALGYREGSGTINIDDNSLERSRFADKTSFAGWNFDGIDGADPVWEINNKLGRPVLISNREADLPFDGRGTEENPYLIHDLAMLEAFRDSVNAGEMYKDRYFKLTKDISMSPFYDSSGESWTPIGASSTTPFKGTFNGDGHTINGLYIKSVSGYYAGLFGYNYGTIQNIELTNVNVTGNNNYVGGLCGSNVGKIEGCSVSGTVESTFTSSFGSTGGVVGYNSSTMAYNSGTTDYYYYSGIITNCNNFGVVSGNNNIGGVVGEIAAGEVYRCRNIGTISKGGYTGGGIAGYVSYSTVSECYNTGAVSDGKYSGGVVGMMTSGTVSDCYNTGAVSGSDNIGGVVGRYDGGGGGSITITISYNLGEIIKKHNNAHAGGVIGCIKNSKTANVTKCYYNSTESSALGYREGSGTINIDDNSLERSQFADKTSFVGWSFEGSDGAVWEISDKLGRPVLISNREADPPFDGNGTEENPYIISTLSMLEALRDNVNAGETYKDMYFKLTKDISMSPFYGSSGESWTPIGNDSTTPFKGIFDGGGHKISSLYINDTIDYYAGLFGNNGGTIQNIELTNVNITGSNRYIGSVCGYSDGKIEGCSVSGTVNSTAKSGSVGTIAGYNNGTITKCCNTGAVSGGEMTGGICGSNTGTITNCCNTCAVSDGANIGGIVGEITLGEVSSCYNIGAVSGGEMAGGVAGEMTGGTIMKCYNTGAVSGSNNIGGVVGQIDEGDAAVTECYNYGAVSGGSANGGVAGYINNSDTLTNCCYNTDAFGGNAAGGQKDTGITVDDETKNGGKTAAEFAKQDTFNGWDFENTWEMSAVLGRPILISNREAEPLFNGAGTSDSPYLIPDLAALETLRDSVNAGETYEGKHFKLTADIEMPSKSWMPIGNSSKVFLGTFDGSNYAIRGLYIKNITGSDIGLFGYSGGTIKNLKLTDVNIIGSNNRISGICANNRSGGIIENCSVSGTVKSTHTSGSVGSIAGYNYGKVENCCNIGAVSGVKYAGGICGYNIGTVSECRSIGTVSDAQYIGGVVGEIIDGEVSGCYNTGAVTTTATPTYAGGVAGEMIGGKASNCYNTAAVSGNFNTGGIVGGINSSSPVTVTSCYNFGAVTAKANGTYAGGAAGYISDSGKVNVTSCYYNSTVFGGDAAGELAPGITVDATAKTAEDFAKQDTFVGWDFENTWEMSAASGRPVLISNREAEPSDEPAPIPITKPHRGGSSLSSYTVTFNANNGEKNTSVKVDKNSTASEPAAPTREGYIFDGWYTDSALTEKYNFSTKVSKPFTLYAKWTEAATPEPTAEADKPAPSDKPENPFADVKSEYWYYEPILGAYADGLMSGVSSTEFAPLKDITRAMFVTVLHRMEGEPQTTADAAFTDVGANEYYANAVSWAVENGIVNGYSETEFAPEDSITREQMAAIIHRYAEFKGYDTSINGMLTYSDSADVSDYAKDAVVWLADNGIMTGGADNNFTPQGHTTRAEAAAVFVRIAQKLNR